VKNLYPETPTAPSNMPKLQAIFHQTANKLQHKALLINLLGWGVAYQLKKWIPLRGAIYLW
jgi:hypothetical protein